MNPLTGNEKMENTGTIGIGNRDWEVEKFKWRKWAWTGVADISEKWSGRPCLNSERTYMKLQEMAGGWRTREREENRSGLRDLRYPKARDDVYNRDSDERLEARSGCSSWD